MVNIYNRTEQCTQGWLYLRTGVYLYFIIEIGSIVFDFV